MSSAPQIQILRTVYQLEREAEGTFSSVWDPVLTEADGLRLLRRASLEWPGDKVRLIKIVTMEKTEVVAVIA